MLVRRRLDDVRSGSGVYLTALIDDLRATGFAVRLVLAPAAAFGSLPLSAPAATLRDRGCTIVWPGTLRLGSWHVALRRRVWGRAVRRAAALGLWVLRHNRRGPRPSLRSDLGRLLHDDDAAAMVAAANEGPSDLVIAEYSSLAPLLSTCRCDRRGVLLHDLFSVRAASFRAVGLPPDHHDVDAETETDWLRAADLCIYASAEEADWMRRRLPGKDHVLFLPPIGTAAHAVPTDPPPSPAADARSAPTPRAVFVGVRHGGNRDALQLMLGTIWPAVHAAVPAAELWIVGEIGAEITDPPPGVRVLGMVEDLSVVGGPDAVGLAPTRAASGVSIKIATYLELGMAVLATDTALAGFGGTVDDAVVHVDGPDAFVAALIRLLSDPAARRAAVARSAAAVAGLRRSQALRRHLLAPTGSPARAEAGPSSPSGRRPA